MEVKVYGIRVGILERDKEGGVRFVPDADWIRGEQHPPLGLAFLQNPRPPVVRGMLPTWFENLLPESGSALRSWICKKHGLRDGDSPGLLAEVGRDLPGAVEVLGGLDPLEELAPVDEPTGNELRFSLAGLQLKLSMLLSGDRFSLPARGESGRWIVKVPGQAFPDLPEVEAATMAWAREVGLETPRFHVLPIENLHGVDPALLGRPLRAFAIERFDRRVSGRVHQEDFAQTLQILPRDKYGSAKAGVSYGSLARLVRDACGPDSQAVFIDRLAFVLASGNDDAHLKNWSFQFSHDHRPWLSPVYDMVATLTWSQGLGGSTLALSFGKARRFAELDREALRRFAERSNAEGVEERFMACLERARSTWPAIREQAPQKMREALRNLWGLVPLLREVGPLES